MMQLIFVPILVIFCAKNLYVECSEDHEEKIERLVQSVTQEYEGYLGKSQSRQSRALENVTQSRILWDTYDFIVVGAGSAGSIIASRLSEISQWSVLLVEAGKEPSPVSDIPAFAPLMYFTEYNWKYLMEKQDNVGLGLQDQLMAWPRGRGIGGTSLINWMIHTRGNRRDYDRWAQMGNPGWSYDEVLPYFLKSEDFLVQNNDAGYHRRGGLLSVEDVPFRTESSHVFVKSAQELGLKYVDYNGRSPIGVSYVQATLKNGRRCSAEKAFLRPVKDRPNLTLLSQATATKVLVDPQTKTAFGVELVYNQQYYRIRTRNEVILSAGAFHSPQLLILSGIGPRRHLRELGIRPAANLPVGQKLYDHLGFPGMVFTLNQPIAANLLDNFNPASYQSFADHGRGPLTVPGGFVEALAYVKTNISKDYPDIQLIFSSGSFHSDGGLLYKNSFRISDRVYDAVWKPLEGQPTWTLLPVLMHPKSFGRLELRSGNPFDSPKFFGNYFTDPGREDIGTLIAAVRIIQKISSSPSFKQYGSKLVTTPIPGCEWPKFDSDQYWECALRHISSTVHNQVATCKMGPPDDPEAVVDPTLRVYGIRNLRVADASVIPIPLTAHANAPAMMIGEKASDLIKQYWRRGAIQ